MSLPAGVRQGPDGKFISVDDHGHECDRIETFVSGLGGEIPAADVSGTSTQRFTADGEGTEVVAMDDILDSDEVGHILDLSVEGVIYWTAGTDDASPGVVEMGYAVADQVGAGGVFAAHSPTVGGTVDFEEGNIDLNPNGADTDSTWLLTGAMAAKSTLEDETNTLGAGGAQGHSAHDAVFAFGEVLLDANDGLFVPVDLRQFAGEVSIGFMITVRGTVAVQDVQDCRFL